MAKRMRSTDKDEGLMGKGVTSLTDDEPYHLSSSSTDDTSTKRRRRRIQSSRNARKNEKLLIYIQENIQQILKLLGEKFDKQSKKDTESKDDISEIRKVSQELIEIKDDTSEMSKQLEKVLENQNVILENQNVQSKELEKLRKQLELHFNGTSHASAAPSSQSDQLQPPRYRLVFTSGIIDKIEKGQNIEISVALLDCNNDQIVESGPLASATVELVVVKADFNRHDNQYNWSREDFECSIKKACHTNTATGDQSVKSIVSNGRFNLVHGAKYHSGSTIFNNSGNKKVRLGVMVVSPTEERVLEGLSNPFFVRGHDRPGRQKNLRHNSSNIHKQALVDNDYQEQISSMPNPQLLSWTNSNQTVGNRLNTSGGQSQLPSLGNSNMVSTEPPTSALVPYADPDSLRVAQAISGQLVAHESSLGVDDSSRDPSFMDDDHFLIHTTDTRFNTNSTTLAVQLVWDRPNVEPSKPHWNLLDQLMQLPKFSNCGLPTKGLMQEHLDPLTIVSKEVMQTSQNRGVTVEPLEPVDSDEECVSQFYIELPNCARTGKFNMGVRLASAREERIQKGVSEPFWVKGRHFAGEFGRVTGKWPEDDTARFNHPLVVQATIADLVTGPLLCTLKRKASCNQYKVTDGMEELCKILELKLPAIMDIIQDAENKGAFHHGVAAWLKCLKTVAYEVNDIFDECNYEAIRREAKKKGHHNKLGTKIGSLIVPAHNPILCHYRMGKKLHRIVQTIEALVTEMNTFGFRHLQQAPPSWQWQQTDSKIIASDKDIVSRSRYEDKKKIVSMLLDEASNMDLMVLPIVGMGGLGKTTLVQLIYNDPAIVKHFVLRRWCCVSDDFDVGTIASNICQTSDKTREKALQELQSVIAGKRYLIVLDDVWNRDEAKWGKLMSCLKKGGRGSAVLTTTRDAEVAQIMKMGIAEAYTIKKLSPKHLKEIVQSRAFNLQKPNIEELEDIVDMIVDRFAGSPLAAKALGSVLNTKTSLREWKVTAKNIICSGETGISPILKLSYEDLQPHMKQCFAFCAIYPKDYKIDKESLIQLWIANDFIPVQEGDLPETVGEKVFKELTWRSFFEEVEQTNPIEYGKSLQLRNGTVFMMHDLIHDLALDVMGKEYVTIVDKPSMKKLWPNSTRHLFLSHYLLDEFLKKQVPALRTLFCTDYASLQPPHIPQLEKRAVRVLPLQSPSYVRHISKYTSLRALHLPQLEQGIEVLHLRCLRYLNLSGNQKLRKLPEYIGRLYNLQTLNLSGCQHIRKLPKSIKRLSSLRHLYTNGCTSLMCMPQGLEHLTSLRTLTYFVVGAGLDCSTIRELQNLNLGGELELNCLENTTEALAKEANLENKEKLTHLSLKWNSEGQEEPVQDCHKKVLCALIPPAGLHMLRIVNYKSISLPSWTTDPSQLQHLTELHLLGCVSCEEFPPFCQLKVLQILYLKKLDKLQSLCNHVPSTPFLELRELRLHDLKSLEKWVLEEGKEEMTFPVLEKLDIKNCPKLTRLLEVPKLKDVELDEGRPLLFSATVKSKQMPSPSMLALPTHDIEVTTAQVDTNNESSESELSLKGLPHEDKDISQEGDNDKLTLIKLASMIEVAAKKGSHDLNLQGKLMNQIEWLPESIGKLTGLVTLDISENRILALPDAIGRLSSLAKLDLHSNRIAQLLESIKYLCNLIYLNLRGNQLSSLPSTIGMLVKLEELDVSANHLTSLPDSIGSLAHLKKLIVETNNLDELPYTIGQCVSLVVLRAGHNHFKALPEAVGKLESLEILSVRYNSIRGLPTTMASLTKLKEVDASFNELESIPENLCFVTSLVKLNVGNNFADLQSLPRSIGNLEMLEELDISNNQIRVFPDSFGKLQRLRVLCAEENPLQVPPRDVVLKGAQAAVQYMAEHVVKRTTRSQPTKTKKTWAQFCFFSRPNKRKHDQIDTTS